MGELMSQLLVTRFGFSKESIVVLSELQTLSEQKPNRDNIEREFLNLSKKASTDSQVFILICGHGSQQPDLDNNNETDPEPDGFDEIFLPADVGKWDGSKQEIENAISDDELQLWITRIRDK